MIPSISDVDRGTRNIVSIVSLIGHHNHIVDLICCDAVDGPASRVRHFEQRSSSGAVYLIRHCHDHDGDDDPDLVADLLHMFLISSHVFLICSGTLVSPWNLLRSVQILYKSIALRHEVPIGPAMTICFAFLDPASTESGKVVSPDVSPLRLQSPTTRRSRPSSSQRPPRTGRAPIESDQAAATARPDYERLVLETLANHVIDAQSPLFKQGQIIRLNLTMRAAYLVNRRAVRAVEAESKAFRATIAQVDHRSLSPEWRALVPSLVVTAPTPTGLCQIAQNLFWTTKIIPSINTCAINMYTTFLSGAQSGFIPQLQHDATVINIVREVCRDTPSSIDQQYNIGKRISRSLLDRFNRSGRRQCASVSLAGRQCIHAFHVVPGDDSSLPADGITIRHHTSAFSFIRSCSCGRTQLTLSDSFETQSADARSIAPCCRDSAIVCPGDVISNIFRLDPAVHLDATSQNLSNMVGISSTRSAIQIWNDTILFAFEFECDLGHRFNARLDRPKWLTNLLPEGRSDPASVTWPVLPTMELALVGKCIECRQSATSTTAETARLRHVFIRTPPDHSVLFRPTVRRRVIRSSRTSAAPVISSDMTDVIHIGPTREFPSDTFVSFCFPLAIDMVVPAGYELVLLEDAVKADFNKSCHDLCQNFVADIGMTIVQ